MAERSIRTDVLVVGGGGGGYRAAIGVRERGARVLLASKGPLARCGATPMAGADLTADGKSLSAMGFNGDPDDTRETWFRDILHQGYVLNDQRLVEIYVRDAPDRIAELLEWGLKVRSSEQRAIMTSGISIIDSLRGHAKQVGVDEAEDLMITDLVTDGGRVVGAVGVDIPTGDRVVIAAKAVVLASGGWHKAYWPNTGTRELTGEGPAMALRAGATLANMEFVTFAANILLWPPRWTGSLFTYIVHMVGGGSLTDSRGDDIFAGFDPYVVHKGTTMEWNKSFISYATARAVREERGSPHGGAFYVLGDKPWETFSKAIEGSFAPGWRYKGADYSELARMFREGEPVEVGPAVEYFEGGVAVDESYATGVEGLYAAGECAVALFGSNRVSAATTEMLVSGAIAGRAAAEYAGTVAANDGVAGKAGPQFDKLAAPLARRDGARPAEVRARIQARAHQQLGPLRTGAELDEFVNFLSDIKRNELGRLAMASPAPAYNAEWVEALELESIVTVLEASARAATLRTESRGVHIRADHFVTDNDSWLKEIVVSGSDGSLALATRPVRVTSLRPPAGSTPFLDMMKRMMEAHSPVGGHH